MRQNVRTSGGASGHKPAQHGQAGRCVGVDLVDVYAHCSLRAQAMHVVHHPVWYIADRTSFSIQQYSALIDRIVRFVPQIQLLTLLKVIQQRQPGSDMTHPRDEEPGFAMTVAKVKILHELVEVGGSTPPCCPQFALCHYECSRSMRVIHGGIGNSEISCQSPVASSLWISLMDVS